MGGAAILTLGLSFSDEITTPVKSIVNTQNPQKSTRQAEDQCEEELLGLRVRDLQSCRVP
jgi:hypothetical protein